MNPNTIQPETWASRNDVPNLWLSPKNNALGASLSLVLVSFFSLTVGWSRVAPSVSPVLANRTYESSIVNCLTLRVSSWLSTEANMQKSEFEPGLAMLSQDFSTNRMVSLSRYEHFSLGKQAHAFLGNVQSTELPRTNQTIDAATDIQFVSSNGSDANDGRSLERPKKTMFAALLALNGGTRKPPTAGHGLVFVNDKVEYGGVTEGNGIWIMGPLDSNFKNPPPGWLRYTGGIRIICLGNANSAPDQHIPQCSINAGGNQDTQHPAVWLSSFAGGFYLDGLGFKYQRVGMRIGIDSNNDRLRGGVQNVELKNVSVNLGDCLAGSGPGIDIGNSTFWVWIIDSFVGGCGNSSYKILPPPMGLARSGNVVTVSGDMLKDISAGQIISIYNPSDPSFAGSCLVLSIPNVHRLTCSQPGPDSSSGAGWVITDQAAAINIDPGGGDGSGLIFFRDDVFEISGPADGIRFQNGLNGGSIDVQSQTCEGSFNTASGPCIHVYWNPRTSPVVNVNVWHAESADNNNGGNLRAPVVQVDGPFDPSTIVVSSAYAGGSVNVAGPMTVLGQYAPNLNGIAESPLREGQIGFFHNRVVGSTDAARRLFAPVAVRYVNLANSSPSAWKLNSQTNATVDLGVVAPDGTNGAGTGAELSGPQNSIIYYHGKQKIAIGDYFVGGVWTRAKRGYAGGLSNFTLNVGGEGNQAEGLTQPAPYRGDGEWEWLFSVKKVTEAKMKDADVSISSSFGVDQPITTYAPVLIHVPTGSISDNEVYELAYNLASYDSSCTVGSVCGLSEQTFRVPGIIHGQFVIADQGRPFAKANVTLSRGWGASAIVSSARGTSQRFLFSIVARGAGIAVNPRIIVDFPTPWPAQPIFFCKQSGGNGLISALSGESEATTEAMTLTFNGTPTNESNYSFTCEGN
jgi:hypothetical protein